ncbi:MAG: hypothetical protein K8R53_06120, partial [Bacteroidales bacterium]|nr:hypothetical protein [Bacteroidales bacterium]
SGLFTGDSKPPEVIVNNPDGGETMSYLDPFAIMWTATDDSFGATPISVGISTQAGHSPTILASDLPNSGNATVTPPGEITDFAKVWVKAVDGFGIEAIDGSDDYFAFKEGISDLSTLFTGDSKPPIVSVLLPNGGETYFYAEPLLIKWDAFDESFGPEPITIAVSYDGGTTYDTVAIGLPNSDSAFVSTQQVLTDSAMVKVFVQDEFGLKAFDASDNVFSLQGIYLDLKAFLEGPFAGTGMLSYLNFFGFIPLNQPYNNPPWNYSGTESVTSMPNNDVVDWVLIEIRDAVDPGSATGTTIVGRQAAFIMEDGSIAALDGSSDLLFGNQINHNMFAVVWHRNHIGIMSAYPLNIDEIVYSYDFTDASEKVYGGSLGYKEIASGIWGMVAGDGNADEQINNGDKNDIWVPQSGTSGYKAGDFDMDGHVHNQDKLEIWIINSGHGGHVPDNLNNCQVPK